MEEDEEAGRVMNVAIDKYTGCALFPFFLVIQLLMEKRMYNLIQWTLPSGGHFAYGKNRFSCSGY